jgi:hypothetical protein
MKTIGAPRARHPAKGGRDQVFDAIGEQARITMIVAHPSVGD